MIKRKEKHKYFIIYTNVRQVAEIVPCLICSSHKKNNDFNWLTTVNV